MSRYQSSRRRPGPETATTTVAEITAAEQAYAARLAADDLAAWQGEFAALPPHEQARLRAEACQEDEASADRFPQASWLEHLCERSVPVDPRDLLAVIEADPAALDLHARERISQLQLVRRLTAWLAARELEIIAGLCPERDGESSDAYLAERHLGEEIAVACRIGTYTAESLIQDARATSTVFRSTRAALARGDLSAAHVQVLVAETDLLGDDPEPRYHPRTGEVLPCRSADDKRREVEARVLARGLQQTPAQFRRTVRTAVCAIDPEGEADRHRRARDQRDVVVRKTAGTGMADLVGHDDAAIVSAVHTELTRRARELQKLRGGARAAHTDPDARIGACRADALAQALLGAPPDRSTGPAAGESTEESVRAANRGLEGHLVMDLATLRREADNPCLLNGEPIPAPVGRELAAAVRAWRRVVTDPVTGHLLDYGRRTYLPEPLTEFIRARDGRCTAPYCERPVREADHRVPFPVGASNTANMGGLCQLHHALKTAGHVDVDDGEASGAMAWVTEWGQHVRTRPQPYLDNPGAGPPIPEPPPERRPPGVDEDDDPIPF